MPNKKTRNRINSINKVKSSLYLKNNFNKEVEITIENTKDISFTLLNNPYLWFLRIIYTLEWIWIYYLYNAVK